MVNCNPETVSTDFDVVDKLYFEELSLERVLDIVEKETPQGGVVSVGGQIPNNLAMKLAGHVRILGTSAESIDVAEDRSKFSRLLDELGIEQPAWSSVTDMDEARRFSKSTGYPVLVRPSYVLSGSAMNVAFDSKELTAFIKAAARISKKYPVVISKFLMKAREVEVDGVCDGERVYIGSVVEHVENAGVHSGDATMSIPTLTIREDVKARIRPYSRNIARSLKIKGPFNIQFLVKSDKVLVIECNLRASRSMPFVSKATGTNLMDIAAKALMGERIEEGEGLPRGYAVKAPQFSFTRLDKADPVTGVEMVSTGEVACFGEKFEDAFITALQASNFYVPESGDGILITMGQTRREIIPYAKALVSNGYRIFATKHTAEDFVKNGIGCQMLHKVSEKTKPNILDFLLSKEIKLVINIPRAGEDDRRILRDEYLIRRKAAEFGIPVVTNMELVRALVKSLTKLNRSFANGRVIMGRALDGPREELAAIPSTN